MTLVLRSRDELDKIESEGEVVIAHADNGNLLILGIEQGNIDRMKEGKPMRISKATHPGFPLECTIVVLLGEPDDIRRQLQPFMNDSETIVIDHRQKRSH